MNEEKGDFFIMRIHTIIHAPFEMPGAIQTWISQKGHHLSSSHTYNGDELPRAAFTFS